MKYDTKLAEKLYAGFSDDEIGSVQELGWAAVYDHELVILTEDNLGFVETHQFDNGKELAEAWASITEQYYDYWEAQEAAELALT